jgi:hypothetical protein
MPTAVQAQPLLIFYFHYDPSFDLPYDGFILLTGFYRPCPFLPLQGYTQYEFGLLPDGIEILSNDNHQIKTMEQEIILEMARLLEKTGLDNVIPVISSSSEHKDQLLENALINLKGLNARYEKSDALNQVQWLMNTYNIQIDELMERIGTE